MIVMEKIQVVGFSIQETIISLLYIYHASRFLKDVYTKQTHQVMQLLIFAQLTAIIFDICLVIVDCNNMFTLKIIIHPFAYAIKLKMEFIVLNQLLALIKHGFAPGEFPAPDEESPDISGPTTARSGKHGPLGQIDTSASGEAQKMCLDSRVAIRDMENQMPAPLAGQTYADMIIPTIDSTLPMSEPEGGRPALTQTLEESHMPVRSFSSPIPLNLSQREHDSDEIVAEMERRYLGRFGMDISR